LALQRAARYDEAAAAYTQAAAFAPDRASIYANLGIVYLALKRPFQAEKELRKAESLAPGDPTIRLNLAVAIWQQGSLAEGRAALEALIAEDPGFASAWYNLACLEAGAGRTADALASLRQAIALHDRYREMARQDPDLLRLSAEPEFRALVGGE
jgi:Flp pilus assembly protein TadD